MKQYSKFVGVDISKHRLDVFVLPEGTTFSVPNTQKGAAEIIRRYAGAAFACEATGGYERAFMLAAAEAGEAVWRLHPADVRAFARLQGVRAKTDPIDARMIARALAAAVEERAPSIVFAESEALKDLVALRAEFVRQICDLKGRLTRLAGGAAKIARAQLKCVEKARKKVEQQIGVEIDRDERLRSAAKRIRTAPGAGEQLAATLLAYLPELGGLSSRQAASLVGVAPHPRQSGGGRRPGRCQDGRAQVRRALYMGALSAIRARIGPFSSFYERLREAGKPFKVAIVAVMRKLIIALNAMMKEERDWRPA